VTGGLDRGNGSPIHSRARGTNPGWPETNLRSRFPPRPAVDSGARSDHARRSPTVLFRNAAGAMPRKEKPL